MSLLEAVQAWLERRGWWYGRMKPCSCPRSERYWGLSTWPSECQRMDDAAEPHHFETDAAHVTEWVRTIQWRCQNCGDTFTQRTGVVVERDVEWKDGQETPA